MTQTSPTLDAARQALRQGDVARADALYRTCTGQGLPVHAEHAGLFYARGDFAGAGRILDAGLERHAGDANLHFLRGLARRAEGRQHDAVADFDAALASAPGFVPARFNRALALLALERIGEAIADMRQACLQAPGDPEAWTHLGLLQVRQEAWGEAIESLRTADRLAPRRPVVLRSLANALAATHRATEALPLLAQAEALTPAEPALLTDHALALLRCGRLEEARTRCERALALSPGDQTALAILYMLHIAGGDTADAGRLMDYPRLVGHDHCLERDGIDPDRLRTAVLAHPDLVWEPAGRSTTRGQQSARLDLGDGSAFGAFGRMVARAVQARMDDLRADPALAGHPWIRGLPARWTLQAWATVLHDDGHQRPHIHPAGWMSGVYYLDPGAPEASGQGCLVFGHPQPDLDLDAEPLEHVHTPAPGQLVMFPSYFFHHTTPYRGARPRISLAFDVLPA